jgi:type II secretory pathway component PulF
MIYSYEAKDAHGHTVTGSLDAHDEHTAAMLVREQGYFPTRLIPAFSGRTAAPRENSPQKPVTTPGRWLMVHLIYPIWTGVSLNELALSYRQFAAMLHAGVPVYQCLTTLVAQTRNATFRRILNTVSLRLQEGETLSNALGEYPWIFTVKRPGVWT